MKPWLPLLLCLSLVGLAWANQHSLVITGQTRNLNVQREDSIHLVGDSNRIEIRGDFSQLELVGNGNQIRLEGQAGTLQVVGSGNTFHWVERAGRSAPSLQSLGSDNKLVPVKP